MNQWSVQPTFNLSKKLKRWKKNSIVLKVVFKFFEPEIKKIYLFQKTEHRKRKLFQL